MRFTSRYVRPTALAEPIRLLVFAAVVAGAFPTLLLGEESATQRRPNILWITCEDMSPNLGCYGDKQAHTPHIDRLASQGLRYLNAFSVAGVCAPSRSCLITGMYPTSIGSQHMRSRATLSPQIRCFSEYLRDAGYYCMNNVKTDYNFEPPKSAWDESSNKAHWRNRKEGQPFFAVFNFTMTHESQVRANEAAYRKHVAGIPKEQLHDPKTVTLPPYYPDTPVTRKDWAQYCDLITAMDREVGKILEQLHADELDDDTVVFFFSDHGVGLPRAKRWMYDSGIKVPLVVRWPGKLDEGTTTDRLVSFVDFGPTVLSIAGVPIAEHLQGVPFLGEKAGPEREYIYAARDRMDERYDIIRAVRDKRFKYIRNYEWFKPYAQEVGYAEQGHIMQELRRLHASGQLDAIQEQFFRPTKPDEELYDLDADPNELHNLAESEDHVDTLDRMRGAHVDWMDSTRDTGLLPEPILVSMAQGAGIHDVVRQPERNVPFAKYRETASLSLLGTDGIPRMVNALADHDPVVRYWAAIGLSAIGLDAQRALPSLITMLDDHSPSVRIAAAQACSRLGERDASLRTLADALKHEQAEVRILAAYTIDDLGDSANSLRPAMQAAVDDSNDYVRRLARHATGVKAIEN